MSSAAAERDASPALAVEELVAGYGGVVALDGGSDPKAPHRPSPTEKKQGSPT